MLCDMICEGIKDEQAAVPFYEKLIRNFPKERKTLIKILADERQHLSLLKTICNRHRCVCASNQK